MLTLVLLALSILPALAQPAAGPGALEVRELELAPHPGDPIIRENFADFQPADAVVLDERKPDTWCLRTKDWPSPLLCSMGNPPDLTYDPGLTGVYDIYVGSRATHFPVVMGLKLASETDFTVITSPRGTTQVHYDWEFAFRREVRMDGEKVYDSGIMHGNDPAKAVSVPLDGVDELTLIVTDAGDDINCDHADWGDARLVGNR